MKIPLLLSLCALSSLSVRAEIIYVDFARGARGVTGREWSQAFKYLSDALASAALKDEIWVTGGTHHLGTKVTQNRYLSTQKRGHWLDFPTGPRTNVLSLRLMKSTDLITFEPVLRNFHSTSTGTSYKIPDLAGGQVFYRLEVSRP